MKPAFLGLGSNLGNRQQYLARALRLLAAGPAIVLVRGSSVYESSPVGVTEQPDFLNLVVQIETTHSPRSLLAACLAVEASLKRERLQRWGPRVIDIDVLLFEELTVSEVDLVVPHPRMHERSFVLIPLAEIVPGLRLHGETVRDRANRIGSSGLRHHLAWSEIYGSDRTESAMSLWRDL